MMSMKNSGGALIAACRASRPRRPDSQGLHREVRMTTMKISGGALDPENRAERPYGANHSRPRAGAVRRRLSGRARADGELLKIPVNTDKYR
ncbi:MAG: hypothetical protein OXL41_06305 [Nitrospinae bacterium]|nr:hypothetical protein [Nitrospinota bacterium]